MKASAALQLLTTIMASGGEEWQLHVPQVPSDVTSRTDLDLGACLDVEALEEASQGLYTEESQENTWVENIIDFTSSGEMTSSGEHVGIVPASTVSACLSYVAATDSVNYSNVELLADSDNAMFDTLQNFVSSAETAVDLTQLTDVESGYQAQPTTVDLTSLAQLMTTGQNITSQTVEESTSSSNGNIPSTLWNLDLTVDTSDQSSSIKERMRTRLSARGVTPSVSQDSDTMASESSRRSHTSSTSSWNQSIDDEDEEDDLQKSVDKREKNRLAAQKCRNKKKDKTESLQKDVHRLEERQERLKEEVRKLRDERETLEEIINIHGVVCPKIRKISNS